MPYFTAEQMLWRFLLKDFIHGKFAFVLHSLLWSHWRGRRGRAHTQNSMGCLQINTLQWVPISSVNILPRADLRTGSGIMWIPWYMPGSLELVSHVAASPTEPFSGSLLRRPAADSPLPLAGFEFILSMSSWPPLTLFPLHLKKSHPWVAAELLYLLPQRQWGVYVPPEKHLMVGVAENISSASLSA